MELAALSTILVHGPVSRTELASRLSLSQSTMTRAVKPLIDRGLVHETSEALEGPGRPSRPLVGAPGDRLYGGAKLTGDEVFAVVTDMLANEVAAEKRDLTSHEPAEVARDVASLLLELAGGRALVGVGVSLGGSAADGSTVDRAPFLGWRHVAFGPLVEAEVRAPVVIDNDLSALTAGEHWFGEARGLEDFAVVTIGAGIGLGMVRHDRVVRTRDMGLGLAGHIPLDPSGPRCFAGHRGCSTALVTIPSIVAQASIGLQRTVTFGEVLDLAREGEPVCAEIIASAARGVGRLLGLVANLAMVETIVLSGEGLAVLDVAGEAMRAQLDEDRDPDAHPLDLRLDRSGFSRWARGAATVAIQSSLRGLVSAPVS
ncbi:ROK family transcriptional regulator [Demequina sp. SYSU T00039]|uniref:ROK family transcriptional regulator n=1 Tax=Demequina lignilytica TaxID=3051663 RepID=A0AAW7M7Y7_9MICO|nr:MULTISPECIES: ROK family transcriptional regulator [unclassified Demequina]MDN4478552.1 ROK family transcriptional regulator [Demequina sp. SYSU T00039-1]MDN4486941.1 ROK family transcriptional regulator [Demequina sp. SYSU T00039]